MEGIASATWKMVSSRLYTLLLVSLSSWTWPSRVMNPIMQSGIFRSWPMTLRENPSGFQSPADFFTSIFTSFTAVSEPLLVLRRRRFGSSTRHHGSDHQHCQVLALRSFSYALLVVSRLCVTVPCPEVLVSRNHVLLFSFDMCILWGHCEYIPEDCGATYDFAVDCRASICKYHQPPDRMELGDWGRGETEQCKTSCFHQQSSKVVFTLVIY
jgi:hypothetical protein